MRNPNNAAQQPERVYNVVENGMVIFTGTLSEIRKFNEERFA